jgi:hypothetical protein
MSVVNASTLFQAHAEKSSKKIGTKAEVAEEVNNDTILVQLLFLSGMEKIKHVHCNIRASSRHGKASKHHTLLPC